MRSISVAVCVVISVVYPGVTMAEEAVTVQSLLKQDFAIVGVITSPAGPGLFLQKKDRLFLCFVAETPSSPAVTTHYCKPVQ